MKNILVSSFGTSWPIIPELVGFFNFKKYNLYKNHPSVLEIEKQRDENNIESVEEVWLAVTNGERVKSNIESLIEWSKKNSDLPKIRCFSYKNLVELDTVDEIDPMADLIYRILLHAQREADGGKVYVSLAGGRKNMSANIQSAYEIFGGDALIHVMDDGNIPSAFYPKQGSEQTLINNFIKIPGSEIKCFFPVVLSGKRDASTLLFVEPQIRCTDFQLLESKSQASEVSLFNEIHKRQKESANGLFSIYQSFYKEEKQNAYFAFHLLHPAKKNQLKAEIIGGKPENIKDDLQWIRSLPKSDLHCHFGGILSLKDIIEVAIENEEEVNSFLKLNKEFGTWFRSIKDYIDKEDIKSLLQYSPKKDIKEYWYKKGIPEPIAISAFIITFKNREDLLENYVYSSVGLFKGIGIDAYEKLGDLQGSSLMQNKKSISKACNILKQYCKEQNVKYIEVRCSPINYTRAGLTAEEVVRILMEKLQSEHTIFKLVFIASRHGDKNRIKEHIDLALKLLKSNAQFKKMFVGFDLAGAESVKSPKELRDDFMEILQKSIPTTIHAGEDMPVKNIWEAVYHLSAERIGHGLTLNEDPDLKRRFKERKIAIELCPSSNDQIVGYNDYHNPIDEYKNNKYPLKDYLKVGLKVTINTDDPGISKTDITSEYYKAACMTHGGLSKWEILQINRNGFKYGFLNLEDKKKLLLDVEGELFELLL